MAQATRGTDAGVHHLNQERGWGGMLRRVSRRAVLAALAGPSPPWQWPCAVAGAEGDRPAGRAPQEGSARPLAKAAQASP